MPPRVYTDTPLRAGLEVELPANATRHVQVLRLQPGEPLILFDGMGGQWQAELLQMGRRSASAQVIAHEPVKRELPLSIGLAVAMPANERMDALIEKATELGVRQIQPLMSARSVLRVEGERAERKSRHWQSIAQAACEQCGRDRVPAVLAPLKFSEALAALAAAGDGPPRLRLLLSLAPDATPLAAWLAGGGLSLPAAADATAGEPASGTIEAEGAPGPTPPDLVLLSGPEGGLTEDEEAAARRAGFRPLGLGPRTLRADTAPLAALAVLAAWAERGA